MLIGFARVSMGEVLNRAGWVASASASDVNSQPAGAIDGNINTRWSTGAFQTFGQWFEVDMGSPQTFNQIVMDCGNSTGDYPRGYQVNVSNDGSNWGSVLVSGAGSTVTTITLTAQTARYVRVTQTGSASANWWSIAEFNILGTSSPPSAPTNLTVTAADSQVSLSWSASPNATSYNVKRSITNGGPYTVIATNVTSFSYINASLSDGTTYYYVVSAVDNAGESPNSIQAIATPIAPAFPPAAPTGVTAAAGNAMVVLSWTVCPGAISYNVKASITDGGPYTVIATNITSLFYENVGLTNGTTYYYVVSAVNGRGEGADSSQASAIPQVTSSNIQDLSATGWRMWPDTNASWTGDTLYLPSQVVLTNLSVNVPTGGWNGLNNAQGISVTLPATVEGYYMATTYPNGYDGVSWWWRTFTAPTLQPGQRLVIQLRSARMRAEVYCNGKLCGYNIITEIPFEADVTDAIRQSATTNVLAVRITNPGGNFSWSDNGTTSWGSYVVPESHAFGGLDAGITMSVCDAVSVHDVAVLNTPVPQQVWLVSTLTNSGALDYNGPLTLDIASNSLPIWQGSASIFVPAGGQATYTNVVTVPNTTLWDLTNPVLYTADAAIPGFSASAASATFGFRWFTPDQIGGNALLRLNGRRIVLRTAISWGYWPINGLYPDDFYAKKEVLAAQSLGLNCLNFHRNIGHPNVLDQQDQLGLLRYEEPGGGDAIFPANNGGNIVKPTDLTGNGGAPVTFLQKYEVAKILAMVRRDRSHPSLVIYGENNENPFSLTNPAAFWLFDQMRQIDPSRTIYLHSGQGEQNQLVSLPYTSGTNFLVEDGTGHSGWNDQHNEGGPGNYQDNLYVNSSNYGLFSSDTSEVTIWGEMYGVGMPDDHDAIVNWYQTNGVFSTGYDLTVHQQALEAYNTFLNKWSFRSAFPTASSLFYEIGKKSYFFWQKMIENGRLCNVNDSLVISGWESTAIDNNSGIVDVFRDFRSDPSIVKEAMNPEVLVIRPKRLVLKIGETANVDVHLINETGRTGAQTLTITAHNPDGSVVFNNQRSVMATGGDVFGQILATNLNFVATTNGTVLIDGTLQPTGGTGDVLTNEAQLLVIDPTAGAPLLSRIAVCEASNQITSTLSNVFGAHPLTVSSLSNSLDAIVMSAIPDPVWLFSSAGTGAAISGTSDPGLFQNQMYGQSGNIGTWYGFAPGNVTVQLYFAEIFFSSAGSRVFDVGLNGTTVLSNLDILQQAGGANIALVKTFTVNSSDGSIVLSIPKIEANNAQIAAIKMTDANGKVIAVVFSGSAFTDHTGQVWQAYLNSLVPLLPVTPVQWQTALNQVYSNGVRLVIWPNGINEGMVFVNLLAASNIVSVLNINGNAGFLGQASASWLGSWYFAQPNWLLDGLPTGSVLGWQYQISHTGPNVGAMLLDSTPRYPMEVMIGYGRDHEPIVGIGGCVIQYGQGVIVLPSLPGLRDALITTNGEITQPVAQRILGNALRNIPPSAPSSPPTLTAIPDNKNKQGILNWFPAFGAASYNVKRAIVSGGPYTVIASNILSMSYTNESLVNGTTYYYVVSGVNSLGESLNSPEATVLLQSPTLSALLAQANGKYVTASGANPLIASQNMVGTNEQFAAVDLGGGKVAFQAVASGLYVTVTSASALTATSPTIGNAETFAITSIGGGNISINASANGSYVSADNAGASPLIANRSTVGVWETYSMIQLISPAPAGLLAIAGDGQVFLNWTDSVGAASYNVKRSITSGGPYAVIATNVTSATYMDSGVTNGTSYYYVVSTINGAGESSNSAQVSARPLSFIGPQLNFGVSSGQIQFTWPQDHTGWSLQVQTNLLAVGLGTNWFTIPGSTATNRMSFLINPTQGSVFFRLVHP